MIHMEKHKSLDDPPTSRFSPALQRLVVVDDDRSPKPELPDTRSKSIGQGIPPSKRVNLRTESIKKLVEWNSLLEITKDQ